MRMFQARQHQCWEMSPRKTLRLIYVRAGFNPCRNNAEPAGQCFNTLKMESQNFDTECFATCLRLCFAASDFLHLCNNLLSINVPVIASVNLVWCKGFGSFFEGEKKKRLRSQLGVVLSQATSQKQNEVLLIVFSFRLLLPATKQSEFLIQHFPKTTEQKPKVQAPVLSFTQLMHHSSEIKCAVTS